MNTDREMDLLLDLAKLLKKHGPETFESLARQLSSPAFLDRLGDFLLSSARAAREAKARRNGAAPNAAASPADFRLALLHLQESAPEKSALLVKFYDELLGRAILPSMRELREFAFRASLPPLTEKSRPKAVIALLAALQGRPVEELRQVLANIEPVARPDDDRSLEGWTRIILDKNLRSKRA